MFYFRQAVLGWASWRLQELGVCQPKAVAGRECLGVLQRSYPLFKTGAMIPEIIGKGRIALNRLPTAGAFFPPLVVTCACEEDHLTSERQQKTRLACSSLRSWSGCCWAPRCGKRPGQVARIVQEHLQQALYVRGCSTAR